MKNDNVSTYEVPMIVSIQIGTICNFLDNSPTGNTQSYTDDDWDTANNE